MIIKVYDILKTLELPLDHILRPDMNKKTNMVISYHLFNEHGYQFGDGKIKKYGGSLQVDLFARHRVDYREIKKKISTILTRAGFTLVNIDTTGEHVDGIGDLDHVIFTFNYIDKDKIFAFDGTWVFNGLDYFGKL